MHPKFTRSFPALARCLMLAAILCNTARGQVIDIIGNLPLGEYTNYISSQSYYDWGNEPCVSVNPLNSNQLVVSSFGYSSWLFGTAAQLWCSTNGGVNWDIRFPVPTPISGDDYFVDDQTYAFDSSGVLHSAMMALSADGSTDYIYHGSTTNVNNSSAWVWNSSPLDIISPDQPWLALGGNRLVIAYEEFGVPVGIEQRVAISTNNGATFPSVLDIAVGSEGGADNSTGGSPVNYINPGLRAAVDKLGDVFVIFGMPSNGISGVPLMNYRLNRFSTGPGWDFTGSTHDAIGGLAITNGLSRQGDNRAFWFASGQNALLGNITSIAVNTNGSKIYVVYGLSGNSGIGRLYLQKFQPSGANLVPIGGPLGFSTTNFNAALPSVAVTDEGVVGIMFDEFDGTNLHIHFAASFDDGQSIATNIDLYNFRTNGMVLGRGTSGHNRLYGDYQVLRALGGAFYGTFAARGNVNAGGITTTNFIDPFFFSFSESKLLARPALTQVAKPAGLFNFTLNGQPGVTYVVQSSSNLVSWVPNATNTAQTATRSISISTTGAQNNYRAVAVP
jgi:hypothetical protein